jgi:hypothetical protein
VYFFVDEYSILQSKKKGDLKKNEKIFTPCDPLSDARIYVSKFLCRIFDLDKIIFILEPTNV